MSRLADLDSTAAKRTLSQSSLLNQIRVADDRCKDRVKIVRDAASKLADCLHLAACDELRLQMFALGNVQGDAAHANRSSRVIADNYHVRLCPYNMSIFMHPSKLLNAAFCTSEN
jgi:hypothetical protein